MPGFVKNCPADWQIVPFSCQAVLCRLKKWLFSAPGIVFRVPSRPHPQTVKAWVGMSGVLVISVRKRLVPRADH